MIDQEDFPGIDEYIKRHGLHDASMAEKRRAKAIGPVETKGDNGLRNGEVGHQASQQEGDEDDEDEEGEDYDPGSEGESEGSGTSSEEEGEGKGEERDPYDDDDDDVGSELEHLEDLE